MLREPPNSAAGSRSVLTLVLCTILHGFTHAYGTLLVPLYLLMVADLKLGGVKAASLIVTVYGLVYCMGSYFAGVVADRTNRKNLLGLGLLGNAAAIGLMGVTRRYELLLALAVLAGIAGTFFHPAANALVPAHFPRSPGMAIGLLGIGSGLGFFVGPQYAGWRARAQAVGWSFGATADWQRPCVELGAAGLVFGAVFMALAREAPRTKSDRSKSQVPATPGQSGAGDAGLIDGCIAAPPRIGSAPAIASAPGIPVAPAIANAPPNAGALSFATRSPLDSAPNPGRRGDEPPLRSEARRRRFAPAWSTPAIPGVPSRETVATDPAPAMPAGMPLRIAGIGVVLGCRDFAGVAGLSLASIYLQKAHGLDAARTGLIVGEMMLLSVLVNPLAVFLTPGRRRLPALVCVLLAGAVVASLVPFAPLGHALAVLCAFQTCQMGSYAVSDAAMLERVPAAVRGRVVGLFLVIAGTFASTGPWVMGWWIDRLGAAATDPHAYAAPFGLLGALMVTATLSTPIIARLGQPGLEQPASVNPLMEVMPRTLEPAG